MAGLISLWWSALVVAVVLFGMPVGQALLAGTEGAAFGFFPILWIVINAIWVYNLTVASGHFDVLRRSFEKVSPDQRIQAIIIAFCFGALLEALAGFGTPVAITVVMLMALGFEPIKAAAVALIANTAPVAFGALATPIVTLAAVSSGASNDPRPRPSRRSVRWSAGRPRSWPSSCRWSWCSWSTARRGVQADLDAGPGLRCRLRSRPVRRRQLHLRPAGRHRRRPGGGRLAVVLLLRVWQPSEVLTAEPAAPASEVGRTGGRHGRRRSDERPCPARRATVPSGAAGTGGDRSHDSGAEVLRRPTRRTLVIIAIFSITNITAVKEFLAEKPFTYAFEWPGLDVRNTAGEPCLDDVQLQLAARRRHLDDHRGHHHMPSS